MKLKSRSDAVCLSSSNQQKTVGELLFSGGRISGKNSDRLAIALYVNLVPYKKTSCLFQSFSISLESNDVPISPQGNLFSMLDLSTGTNLKDMQIPWAQLKTS